MRRRGEKPRPEEALFHLRQILPPPLIEEALSVLVRELLRQVGAQNQRAVKVLPGTAKVTGERGKLGPRRLEPQVEFRENPPDNGAARLVEVLPGSVGLTEKEAGFTA